MSRFFYFLVMLTSIVYGQEPSSYVVGKDIFDGVKLYSVIQDEDASVWISSDRGLYNYNGIHFKHISIEDSKSSVLFGLIKNSKGSIFCHNLTGQIYIIRNGKLVLYFTIPKNYHNLQQILFDKFDNLLIQTNGNLLTITKDKKLTIEKDSGSSLIKHNNSIYYIENKKGYLNLVLRKKNRNYTINRFKKKGAYLFQQKLFPINNFFYGHSYRGREKSFFKLENNLIKNIPLSFIDHHDFRMYQTKNDLWFCDIKKGVYKVENKSIDNKPSPKKWFKEYYISQVMVDNEENTWLLTFDKGIIIVPNKNIKNYKYSLNSEISGISKSNQTIYIGTLDGDIFKLKNKIPYYFFNAHQDRLEHFSVLNNENLIVTNTGFYTSENKRVATSFNRSGVLLNDTLYCAIYNGVQAHSINSGKSKKLTTDRTYKILYDSIGKQIWVASSVGLSRYKKGENIPVKVDNKQLMTRDMLQVEDEIWATTRRGIVVFKESKFNNILTEKDGLFTNNISSIKYERPYAYLYSDKGMQRYDTHKKVFKNIRKSDGLLKNISRFEVLKDTVYALNSDGLISFTFDHVSNKVPKYQTQISKVTCNGNKIIEPNCVLKSDENNIEFAFLTTTFKYQKNLSYEYQLKGFEKKNIKAKENQNYVNYSNLPPGTYTFVVDSFIDKQKNNSAIFTFTIQKHWNQKNEFKLIFILFIVLILFGILKYRRQVLKSKHEKEVMLKRLAESSLTSLKAQMNPHFLFNAMNSIQTLILTKKNKEAYEYLTELANLVRENLKMSDVSFVSFQDELNVIKRYLELEKLRFGDTFSYEIINNIAKYRISIPSMIIQPFIENAIKHGLLHRKTNRFVEIEFKEMEGMMCCIVTDNGIGRVASQKIYKNRKYKSFSTNAIQERFSILREYYKLDISFSYEDLYTADKVSGTKVIIKFPFTDE